jgi:hypothetical protein
LSAAEDAFKQAVLLELLGKAKNRKSRNAKAVPLVNLIRELRCIEHPSGQISTDGREERHQRFHQTGFSLVLQPVSECTVGQQCTFWFLNSCHLSPNSLNLVRFESLNFC